eukprot:386366_1
MDDRIWVIAERAATVRKDDKALALAKECRGLMHRDSDAANRCVAGAKPQPLAVSKEEAKKAALPLEIESLTPDNLDLMIAEVEWCSNTVYNTTPQQTEQATLRWQKQLAVLKGLKSEKGWTMAEARRRLWDADAAAIAEANPDWAQYHYLPPLPPVLKDSSGSVLVLRELMLYDQQAKFAEVKREDP